MHIKSCIACHSFIVIGVGPFKKKKKEKKKRVGLRYTVILVSEFIRL